MSRSLHPPCAGSAFYGPHSAKIPHGYTVIAPGGAVFYTCDTDCLQRTIEATIEANIRADRLPLSVKTASVDSPARTRAREGTAV